MLTLEKKKIYIAAQPVDFRMSIDGLSSIIQKDRGSHIHDGSIYVFYNGNKNKIKCLFWDNNGFVLYYKRLDNCKFKFKIMTKNMDSLTTEELHVLLSGYDPAFVERKPHVSEMKLFGNK
jgi:transposase